MKVHLLKTNPLQYSSNSYLLLGDWNRIDDVNTVIDVGIDGYILDTISAVSTGVGKKAIEQVLLTHTHFDHAAGLPEVYSRYKPKIWAFGETKVPGFRLQDGQLLKCGDDYLEVIHTPFHSNDSVCFYNKPAGIIFPGDLTMVIVGNDGTYPEAFLKFFHRLMRMRIKAIYPGHGDIIFKDVDKVLKMSLGNMEKSTILK